MSDRRLKVFQAVAHLRSFTKAAEALYMTQPAVSFQIRQIEEQYNTRLLERSPGRIALTPAGEIVLDYAERILALSGELDQRIAEMTGTIRGPLAIGASPGIAGSGLATIVADFAKLYPDVRTRLLVGNADELQEQILAQRADLAIVAETTLKPGIEAEFLCEEEMVAVFADGHPLAACEWLGPVQLVGHGQVVREAGSSTRELVERYLEAASIDPGSVPTVMEVGSPQALLAVVASGLGYAIVSRSSLRHEGGEGASATATQVALRRVPLRPRLARRLCLVHLRERFRSRLISAFMDFAGRRLRAGDY